MAKKLAWEASEDLTLWSTGYVNTSALVQKVNGRYKLTTFDTVDFSKTDHGSFATAELAKDEVQRMYEEFVGVL